MKPSFWKTVDLTAFRVPEETKHKTELVTVIERTAVVGDVTVFYREANPPPECPLSHVSVLLLHGASFSSKTWYDINTARTLASFGYRNISIDLPGYGQSPPAVVHDKAEFLEYILKMFNLNHAVIISPSMSGYYSLPYLIKYWNKLAGYVPVAPVGIDVLEQQPKAADRYWTDHACETLKEYLHEPLPDLRKFETPTMVVFGEKDRSRSSALLSLLPCSRCYEIPNGHHPAYLDNPPLWHQLLYNFLHHVANDTK